ncbi:MAG: TIGR02452 family protein [Eubacterium sp.]|nr:TIGR02452 family protein [Eubacterium sp.]
MGREENVQVFEDTKKMYLNINKLKNSIGESLSGQRIYPETESVKKPEKKDYDTRVVVTRSRSIEAAMNYRGKKVCVHNFASATNPGGGVERGSSAQEECLCRVSTLFPCLSTQINFDGFYQPHRNMHNPVYNADCIFTPGVTVFKSDKAVPELLPENEWMQVDIITCAAPNLRANPSNAMNPYAGNKPAKLSEQELLDIHKKRGRRILDIAAANGCEVVILGAFGCGAFRNDPKTVARAYREILNDYDGYFDTIEFAVYCSPHDIGNYDAFDREMNLL